MRKNINKLSAKHIDAFMEKFSKEVKFEDNELSNGTKYQTKSINLFAYLEEKKKVLGYLETKGVDVWKRGTKEPERVRVALETADWNETQQSVQRGISMFD